MHILLNSINDAIQELKAYCEIANIIQNNTPLFKPENLKRIRDCEFYVCLMNKNIEVMTDQL